MDARVEQPIVQRPENPAAHPPLPRLIESSKGRLFRKYAALLVALVATALIANGLIEGYYSYLENRASLVAVQREKAIGAASVIEQFVKEIEGQLGWTTHASVIQGPSGLEQRRFDLLRLLRQAPAITEVAYADADGREQLRVSRLAMDVLGSATDRSGDTPFKEARDKRRYVSPVYFRKESEPYLTLAIAGSGRRSGVSIAEVNLKFIWDVISRIRAGKAGTAYAVDDRGLLIAHPDIGLVLRKTDMSGLAQVKAALAPRPAGTPADSPSVALDRSGREVLTAQAAVGTLGWHVFVEQPVSEAFEPLYESLLRSAIVLVLGLSLAALAGLWLAQRMVVPIQALSVGAAKLGGGDLDHRISIEKGLGSDDFQLLADSFNDMGGRLKESYEGLERKVEERTAELAEALEYQTATSDVLNVISRSPNDVQPVLEAIVRTAARLCAAEYSFIVRNREDQFHLVAADRMESEHAQYLLQHPVDIDRSSITGRVALDRRLVHVADVLADKDYTHFDWQKVGKQRSVLGVPLLREGTLLGVMILARTEVREFTARQIELVETFADQAVIAIQNAELFDEVQARTRDLARSVQELRALGELGQAVSSTLDLEQVLTTVVTRARELGNADGCAIFRYRERDQMLRLWQVAGLDAETEAEVRKFNLPAAGSLMGRALASREAFQVSELESGPDNPLKQLALAQGIKTALFVPLVRSDTAFGVMLLQRRRAEAFDAGTVSLLLTFASQSILAIQNARLFREIEEKSRQIAIASQHKSQFLANMSHELRTPLNAILGYTELLGDGIYGQLGEKPASVLGRIEKNGKHLLGLINEVLDLAKIEAGEMTLTFEDYDWQSVIQTVAAAAEPLAQQKGLLLHTEVQRGMPIGYGDGRRLSQVLLNLVGNAIKFTETGSVRVRASAKDDQFHIAVTDTGPGIAPADQARIFEKFQQVDNTSTRKQGGTGLGLAISREFVEIHGGRIEIASEPGQGSTFEIILPVRGGKGTDAHGQSHTRH